ncbi:hypothetical protein JTB14_004293 [Gonioctena quinquepunctata]|nr:hypothetical protein JTB14_004293 [Gonioctena quinquepunctata]
MVGTPVQRRALNSSSAVRIGINVLQVNLGHAKAAHDLAYVKMNEISANLMVVPEPNLALTALYVYGCVAVCWNEVTLVACYILTNIPLEAYKRKVDAIGASANAFPGSVIAGDIDAKSPYGLPPEMLRKENNEENG